MQSQAPMVRRQAERKGKILVVEDNPLLQEVLGEALLHEGHTCTLTANGKDALAVMGDGSFDVILMDCEMPEMGGFEATQLIRSSENPQWRSVPIIAITADGRKEAVKEFLEIGMNDFVAKPIDLDQLLEKIQNWLK